MVRRTGEASQHIEAPPEALYALVSDVTRMGEWSPETVRAEWVDAATGPAVGARFRGHNKRRAGWKTTCTVTAAEPGRQFAFEVGKGETAWRYSFAPSGTGTNVTESFEIVREPNVVIRKLNKLGTGVSWEDRPAQMEDGMRQTLERLKAVAEKQ
jgi:uncharacterized protein YndB with AHSA1/START domain